MAAVKSRKLCSGQCHDFSHMWATHTTLRQCWVTNGETSGIKLLIKRSYILSRKDFIVLERSLADILVSKNLCRCHFDIRDDKLDELDIKTQEDQ